MSETTVGPGNSGQQGRQKVSSAPKFTGCCVPLTFHVPSLGPDQRGGQLASLWRWGTELGTCLGRVWRRAGLLLSSFLVPGAGQGAGRRPARARRPPPASARGRRGPRGSSPRRRLLGLLRLLPAPDRGGPDAPHRRGEAGAAPAEEAASLRTGAGGRAGPGGGGRAQSTDRLAGLPRRPPRPGSAMRAAPRAPRPARPSRAPKPGPRC